MLCVYTVLQCCSVDDGRWDSGSFAGRLSVMFFWCAVLHLYTFKELGFGKNRSGIEDDEMF